MLLPIDSIREHPQNARTIGASPEADAALIESIRVLGLLQPILVVPDLRFEVNQSAPVAWELRAGARRLRAVKALGWEMIPAVEFEGHGGTGATGPVDGDPPETAISAAENMVRVGMHPVDQWRAICDLRTNSGYSLDTAAAALGILPALARRMEWLGAMAPALLEAIGQGDLPGPGFLRTIALATHDMQLAALEQATMQTRGGATVVDWRIVAERCTIRRIPRTRAIFSPDLMAWDEDLFAEGDDEDRFTTTEVDAFLAHQRAALEARIAKSKGRMLAYEQDPANYRTTLPKGWEADQYAAIPKRFRQDDPRKVFLTLSEKAHDYGEVVSCLGIPRQASIAAKDGSSRLTPAPRPPITKKTMQHLAKLKAQAVQSKLLEVQEQGPAAMLRAMLLMFTFKNVRAGGIAGSPYGTLSSLVTQDGTVRADLSDADLCAGAAWLISAAVTFDAPDEFNASGPGAEWLALMIGAEMPRTDTIDILAGVNGETLRDLAQAHAIPTAGTLGALRKRLTGALPDWRAVQFGAPGPRDTEDETDTPDDAPDLAPPDDGDSLDTSFDGAAA